MDLIVVIAIIYIGGPLGLLCLLIAAVQMVRNRVRGTSHNTAGWAFFGIILLLVAAGLFYQLSQVNFGL